MKQRLIDANALREIIERELYHAENSTIHRTLNYCLGAIQNAPTVSLTTPSDIDELCRLRSDLKSGLHVGSTLRTRAQMNKFIRVLDKIIDNALPVTPGSWSEGYHEGFQTGSELGKAFSRPQGEWIVVKQDNEGIHEIECPFCHYSKGSDFSSILTVTFDKFPPFCENCGSELGGDINDASIGTT